MAATRPTFTIEVDFVNDPTSVTETWTDITRYVRGKGPSAQLLSSTRGRNYELARTENGNLKLLLDNTDGRFDPSNQSSPYVTGTANPGGAAGLIVSQRRIRVRATWAGTTYALWRGYVDEWPQEWTDGGFFGISNLAGIDAIAPLSAVALQAITTVEVLKDNPLGYYRCNDDNGSVAAANSSSIVQPDSAIVAGYLTNANDDFTFGDQSGSDQLAGDPTTSLTLKATIDDFGNTSGYALRTADLGAGPLVPVSGGWAVECWFYSTSSSTGVGTTNNFGSMLFEQLDVNGNPQVRIDLLSNANSFHPRVNTFDGGTGGAIGAVTTSTANITDGRWHHVAATLSADGKTLTLYVDGVSQGSNTLGTSQTSTWVTPRQNHWGASYGPLRTGGYYFLNGSLKNLATFSGPLSAARVLAHFQAGTAFSGEATGTRVGRLLDAAAWPSALRTVATGDSVAGAQATENMKASEALQQVIDTERGNLFISADGKVSFANRQARYNGSSVATFGENAGENHYVEGIRFTADPKDIYNDVSVNRLNGITVRDQDSASQLRYFPRSLSVSTVAPTDIQSLYLAEYLIARYKDQVVRVPELVLEPTSNTSLWPQVLGREIGDRITVKRRPGGATAISADFFIESVAHEVTPSSWRTTWQLSPASLDSYFELDSATYSRLADVVGAYTLSGSLTSGAGSTTVAFTTSDPPWTTTDLPLTVQVDREQITVTAIGASTGTSQVFTITRGANGTAAAAHNAGAVVTLVDDYPLTL